MPLTLAGLQIIGGIVYLLMGGDLLVRGAMGLARTARISPMVVGLTVVALGTSAPELVVTLQADVRLVQAISAGSLGNIGPEAYKAIPALRLAEQGEHEIVRFKATVALVKIIRGMGQSVPVADDAVPTLIEALASQTPGVVQEAAMTLEAIGPAAIVALPYLETIKNSDAHQSVRARTSAALARIKP